MKTLQQSPYPPPKFLRFRRLNSFFAMCDIVFMSIITNVAHRSFTSKYTKMRCKDTNFISNKCQNAQIIFVFTTIFSFLAAFPLLFIDDNKDN